MLRQLVKMIGLGVLYSVFCILLEEILQAFGCSAIILVTLVLENFFDIYRKLPFYVEVSK